MRQIAINIADSYELMFLFLGVFALFIRANREKYKWIIVFLISIGALKVTSIFFAKNGINTIPFYHITGALELVLGYKIYQFRLKGELWKWLLWFILSVYVINSFMLQTVWEMNGLMQAIVQLFIFGLSTNYLFSIYLQSDRNHRIVPEFFFANAGFMLYATGSFIVFLISERIIIGVTSELFDSAWLIEAIFGILRLIFIALTLRLRNGK